MVNYNEIDKKLSQTEMCDVCGKSYLSQYIRRISLYGKQLNKTLFTIRYCPYCDPRVLADKL
jgi:hypothetical protein